MSDGPLPKRVNIRKAVTRKASYSGQLSAAELPEYESCLQGLDSPVALQAEFGEDEEDQQFIAVSLRARVILECQRCLEPVEVALESKSRLALVPGDEQARHISAGYEPLIAVDEVDLWQIGSEELALAMPVVAYHPSGECSVPAGAQTKMVDEGQVPEPETGESDNPFSVLSSLLGSDDVQEK